MKKTVKKQKVKSAITYKNKDVTSKMLAERLKDNFFEVFGLDLPPIVSVEPTNLPAVEANELQMDNLFLLQDGSYVIIDYESTYSEANKLKYLGYIARLAERLYNNCKRIPRIGVVILYTADVLRGATNPSIEFRQGALPITEAFLSDLDAYVLIDEVEEKISQKKYLDNSDLIRLIICPLAVKGADRRNDLISRIIRLITKIEDELTKKYILRGLLVFTDKVISREDSDKIRRMLTMTKVEQLIYDDFCKDMDKKVKKAKRETKIDTQNEIAVRMIKMGDSLNTVADRTGMQLSKVEKLAAQIKVEA